MEGEVNSKKIGIPFNKPYLSGKELCYIAKAVDSGKISGDGDFTRRCHYFFESRFGFPKCLLTTSCTDALEMVAILLDIHPGDEIIMPSYTFVSTANAFVLRGAKIVFCDSLADHPCINFAQIEDLITPKTRAIVVVHYAGIACDMDTIMDVAQRHSLVLIEDAAQAIDSYYKGKPLGSFGQMAAFSFHETKNIQCGEGGMLVINDESFIKRAEIIREKGTNRSAFFRGEVDKYNWVDIGSSFLPSEVMAAFLYAQIEQLDDIQKKRKLIWQTYYSELHPLESAGKFHLPRIPDFATNNAHMFYIVCNNRKEREDFIKHLKRDDIMVVFHYLSLHRSPFYKDKYLGKELPNADRFSDCLVRLPLYYELNAQDQRRIIRNIHSFYN